MTNIKGFIFDLDGTLALSQNFHFRAYERVFDEYGITYTKKEDQTKYAGKGAEKTFKSVFTKHGKPLTSKEVDKFAVKKREIYMQMIEGTDIDVVPGVKKFLDNAIKKGIKIIIATGSRHESSNVVLEKTNLKKYFDTVITNTDIKNSKPAPDIYLKAAEEMGLDPASCVVFEDSTMGVHGAKAANIYCIGLATTLSKEDLEKEGADMSIADYNELINSDFYKNL